MSDVAVSNQLLGLTPRLYQSTPLFGLLLTKSSALFAIKSRAKLMLFGDIPQSEMLLNHFMSSI